MSQQYEDTFAAEAFDVLIITMSAWRRLRRHIEETGKKDPEKNGNIAAMLLTIMDLAYNEAATDMANHKKSMEHNLKKARENTRYGKVGE